MKFWKALGWFGAVAFLLILLAGALVNGRSDSAASEDAPRPAPLIVR